MKSLAIASSLALAAALVGCNKQPEAPTGNISDSAMPMEMKHGKGAGRVTAIDTAKGKVTLDHGAITELEWPAMEMSFSAKPEVLTGIKVGDKVDLRSTGTERRGQ